MWYDLIYVGGGRYCASGKCRHTKQSYFTSPFKLADYCEWKVSRKPIQETELASLTADDREFLISCIHPDLFDNLKDDE